MSQFSAKMRDLLHKREQDSLSSFAQFSEYSKGRSLSSLDDTGDFRLCYHRDKDRIIHSKPFRRLKGKTQVFLFPIGDHYRTRLSHTLEVSQISRTVAKALSLNEDLTEAVALGHDLGHTPFGHFGERVLNSIVPGGFHHAVQSERIVRQMNVSIEVCDGVAKHSKGKGPVLDDNMSRYSLSLEGQIVRVADIIAYLNHDLDDSLRAGIICKDDIPKSVVEVLGSDSKCRLTNMIGDLIIETYAMMEKGFKGYSRRVYMSDSLIKAIGELREFMFEMVYECHSVSEDFDKIFEVCSSLYNFFIKNPDKLMRQMEVKEYDDIKMMAADYLSGMTDHYALHLYRQMFLPKGWASDEIVRFK